MSKRTNPYNWPKGGPTKIARKDYSTNPARLNNPIPRNLQGQVRTVGAYKRSLPGSAEKKYLDTTITNSADVTSGTVLSSLNLVPQGTTDVTRIGNKITATNINIHGIATLDSSLTAPTAANFRVIVFIDYQANGATAAVTDILKTASIVSFRNMDQVDRFKILEDFVIRLTPGVIGSIASDNCNMRWAVNKKVNIPIHFSSTTGAITELKSNNIGLLFIADSALVNVTTLGIARVKYIDL